MKDPFPEDEELKESIQKGDAEKNVEANSEVLLAEMIEFQRNKWENNRLCDCSARTPRNCECDLDSKQIKSWIRRTNRKTSEKFDARINTLLKAKSTMNNRDISNI